MVTKLSRAQKLKRARGVCIHHGCEGRPGKKRLVCYTHKQMYWANRYPIRARYNTLKQNAKRRGHEFGITYAEYEAFVKRTGYYLYAGIFAHDLTIDRILPHEGYYIWNMQVITKRLNTHKRNYSDYAPSPSLPGMEYPYHLNAAA